MNSYCIGANRNKWRQSKYRNQEFKHFHQKQQRHNKLQHKKSKKNKKCNHVEYAEDINTHKQRQHKYQLHNPTKQQIKILHWSTILSFFQRKKSVTLIHIHQSATIKQLFQLICDKLNCKLHHFTLLRETFDTKSNMSVRHDLLMFANINDTLFYHKITSQTVLYFEWRTVNVYLKAFNNPLFKVDDIKYNDCPQNIIWMYQLTHKLSSISSTVSYQLLYQNKPIIKMNNDHCLDFKSTHDKLYQMDLPQNLLLSLKCHVQINIPNNGTVDIQINNLTTIGDLKQIICNKYNIPKYTFQFVPGKFYLSCSDTEPIPESTVVCTLRHKICFEWMKTNIYINDIELSHVSFGITFKDIKKQYSLMMGISYSFYVLCYCNRELNNDKTLYYYKIKPNAKLKLLFSVRIVFPNESTISVSLSPHDSVKYLRSKIQKRLKIKSLDEFSLYITPHINNQYLLDIKTLSEYGIKHNHCIYLVYLLYSVANEMFFNTVFESINIISNVQLSAQTLKGTCIELNSVKLTDTVGQMKLLIQAELAIYHKTQTLIYNGYELDDNVTMKELNIDSGNIFYIMIVSDKHLHGLLIDNIISQIDYSNQYEMDELQRIETLFKSTSHVNDVFVKMDHIYKIKQNYKQNQMIFNGLLGLKQNKNVKMLFHGSSLKVIKTIISNGFNRDYNKRHLYGKGSYFSNIAHMSAVYSQQKSNLDKEDLYVMLCCRTYIGDSTIGKHTMEENELFKADKVTLYDSFVDDLDNPTIFVINRDYHSIPCYLIVFSIHNVE